MFWDDPTTSCGFVLCQILRVFLLLPSQKKVLLDKVKTTRKPEVIRKKDWEGYLPPLDPNVVVARSLLQPLGGQIIEDQLEKARGREDDCNRQFQKTKSNCKREILLYRLQALRTKLILYLSDWRSDRGWMACVHFRGESVAIDSELLTVRTKSFRHVKVSTCQGHVVLNSQELQYYNGSLVPWSPYDVLKYRNALC